MGNVSIPGGVARWTVIQFEVENSFIGYKRGSEYGRYSMINVNYTGRKQNKQ